jgi:CheY-like chemotaxis protein
VAILDIAMPNGDGLQTCAALRRMANWQGVPILILTSHHTDRALRAARRAGATGFVCKPFVASHLLLRIASLTGKADARSLHEPMVWQEPAAEERPPDNVPPVSIEWQRADTLPQQDDRFATDRAVLHDWRSMGPSEPAPQGHASARREPVELRRRRILVAEDEELTQEIVVHVLTQEGCLVHRAANGQEALAAVIRGQYDLVLMDVNMPGLGGIEAARTIRSLPNQKRSVPIVAMTANAFHLYADEMQSAGMSGYLMKPVSPSALIGCVREHLGGAPSVPSSQPNGAARALDLDLLSNEARLFAPGAMGRFLSNLATSIEEILPIVQGWVISDQADVVRRLHNLAGVAGTLGCTRLSQVARELETEPAPNEELRERFVGAARESVAAIRDYHEA